MALEITDATFEETVLKSDKPVLVDFWAAWCGPCRMVGPIIEEVSTEYAETVVVGKMDVDAGRKDGARFFSHWQGLPAETLVYTSPSQTTLLFTAATPPSQRSDGASQHASTPRKGCSPRSRMPS